SSAASDVYKRQPQDCPKDGTGDDDASPLTRPPLFDHLDFRRARGTFPWADDWHPGLPLIYSRWGRYHHRPERPDGSYDPLALLPMADLPGPSVWVRFGPGEPLRQLVSLELTIHFLEPVHDDWVLADFRARWLGSGYALSECDLWSGGRLVAVANQMMLLRQRGG
ncbi:MAG: thioesterase family protein, partial [Acidimicrobiales bacterium]|nr:thioesterase family protein [Acidimicrobiales bacterium]